MAQHAMYGLLDMTRPGTPWLKASFTATAQLFDLIVHVFVIDDNIAGPLENIQVPSAPCRTRLAGEYRPMSTMHNAAALASNL